ncbi:MAG: sodium:solute symporter [Prevotellaceae bacterium]|nr:sodium:solute symporter [Prevotellaceae bacterium]
MIILLTILLYFVVLTFYSRFVTGRKSSNETFFRGNRKSPWYMVAFGMVGASISGITFVSVPGMVMKSGMAYLQTCIGFIFGYIAVAFILLPIYYRLNLTTIYSFLRDRVGQSGYKTGASFFLLSKMTGAAARFYVVCILLNDYVIGPMCPSVDKALLFPVIIIAMVALIWLYTKSGGIKTLVWTDTLQTTCMFTALLLIIYNVVSYLGMDASEAVNAVWSSPNGLSSVSFDFVSIISGMFIVIVMTGLDQDMMQKNLTCRSLRDAQKDMCTYGVAFVPANLLFMCLGVLLILLTSKMGMQLPASGDDLLPMFAATGILGTPVIVLFTIGIMAASFSSADSALTALTTTYCVDICERPSDERLRHRVHVAMAIIFAVCILAFKAFNSTSLIDAIYIMCSYTYGPLLGLFTYALTSRKQPQKQSFIPYICIASPLICYALDTICTNYFSYHFGYELLMINGALTYLGLRILR